MNVDTGLETPEVGSARDRVDGPEKVSGRAKYAFEYDVERVAYVGPVPSTIAKGRVTQIDAAAALALPGVLAVLTHQNAPRLEPLEDRDLVVLQSDAVAYRGQFVAAAVAETSETARHAAELVRVLYEQEPHDVELRTDRDDLVAPAHLPDENVPLYPGDSAAGDFDAAFAVAPLTLDLTYTTPSEHNNPMEPRASQAIWGDDGISVTIYDTTAGVHWVRGEVAKAFGLDPERVHVIAPVVGGAFGTKTFSYPHVILTVMAAKAIGRPAKLALSRQQMFALAGFRTPTIQRVRLGADRDGRLTAIAHDVVEQASRTHQFAEKTAVATRTMYAAPNRRTTHRLALLDTPVNGWMRAPGECPGMFALESAMDELADLSRLDPIELRIRNEPSVEPEGGRPFSSRGLVECLRTGAERFGWAGRDPRPRQRRHGSRLIGTGVAASTYRVYLFPANAWARAHVSGRFEVGIGAADTGTGSSTALAQIAADALGVPIDRVALRIGNSSLPRVFGAAGSSGTGSWGWAILGAARNLRAKIDDECGGVVPPEGLEARGVFDGNPDAQRYAMHAYGAQFAEVHVDEDSGEVRVPRLIGVFGVGRVVNPKTARSQLVGGMTWGLSMALHEQSVLDPVFGDFVNHDLAGYHIASNADVGSIEAAWIEEDDPHVNPMGTKGLGEVGIVGTAAAIANAVYHATGVRVRDLPITPDKVLVGLPP